MRYELEKARCCLPVAVGDIQVQLNDTTSLWIPPTAMGASTTKNDLVLVTGGSGFLGAHCVLACLNQGYRVRTTIRSASRQNDIITMLKASTAPRLDTAHLSKLSFAVADLLKDEGWNDAVKDCTYVLHVASPFPAAAPNHEDELIIPAREGTLRVLHAARNSGTVKRIVITSSFAAIGYGVDPEKGRPFTEKNWTPLDGKGGHYVSAYQKSKTIAEKAAWDFIENKGRGLELSVVNPVGIFGPVMGKDFATSITLIQRLLNGALPGCPDLQFGIIDARDVADLHLCAMTHPRAKGERFLAVAPPCMTVHEMSLALRERLGEKAKRVPTRTIPHFVLRMVALWDSAAAYVTPELGMYREISNGKAKKLLGWEPRWSNVDAVVATAESLIGFGLVKAT